VLDCFRAKRSPRSTGCHLCFQHAASALAQVGQSLSGISIRDGKRRTK